MTLTDGMYRKLLDAIGVLEMMRVHPDLGIREDVEAVVNRLAEVTDALSDHEQEMQEAMPF